MRLAPTKKAQPVRIEPESRLTSLLNFFEKESRAFLLEKHDHCLNLLAGFLASGSKPVTVAAQRWTCTRLPPLRPGIRASGHREEWDKVVKGGKFTNLSPYYYTQTTWLRDYQITGILFTFQ
jgi:hypothetical protein